MHTMMWAKSLAILALAMVVADASTLTPPVLPLLVRNPYLSLWLGNARGEPWEEWPMFYTGARVGCLADTLTEGLVGLADGGCRWDYR